jgi:nitrogen regulatory protein PII-like uncharacterized protein
VSLALFSIAAVVVSGIVREEAVRGIEREIETTLAKIEDGAL